MKKVLRTIERMKRNPKGDWRLDELKSIANRLGVEYVQPGTSHCAFRFNSLSKVTVPARKPIKPIYVKQFVKFVEEVLNEKR